MPIPLTDLDDLRYDELVAQARALIPALHPGWTDHNPSDPGVALIELFAWLTEMLAFQVNEIPDSHTQRFLALLNGPGWSASAGGSLPADVQDTLRALRRRYRAATAADFEHLLAEQWPASEQAAALPGPSVLRRVHCVPRLDLSRPDPEARADPAPAHVSVVVVPEPSGGSDFALPAPELLPAVRAFLGPRLLVTTRLHVVGPDYVDVGISAELALRDDAPAAEALAAVHEALLATFSPHTGGPSGQGWPFGRAVFASDVYTVVDGIDLVDYAERVRLIGPGGPVAEELAVPAVELEPHQLPRVASIDLVAYDRYGRTFPYHWVVPR